MNERYQEALRRFHARSDFEKGSITNPFGRDGSEGERGLARTRALLERLSNPHEQVPVVHIAGSKGKGSTTAFLATMLTAAGLRTGRYVSPHLHTLRERIAIDGEPMSEEAFVNSLDEVLRHTAAVETDQPDLGRITAFEISTAMAFAQFQSSGCDVAVIEVGLGGTWDATNVVTPSLSVIALLDYEHTAILGDTMTEIAQNKAGIIKPGRPVISLSQPAEGMAVIDAVARARHAPLFVEERDWHARGAWRAATFIAGSRTIGPVKLGLTGPHQVRNAGLAVMAALILADTPPCGDAPAALLSDAQRALITDTAIVRGLEQTAWPARFEVIERGGAPPVVIDGAHTRASARALVDTLDEEFPDAPVAFIFGMLGSKDAAGMLTELHRRSDLVALVRPANPRAMTLDDMVAAATAAGLAPIVEPSIDHAIAAAMQRTGDSGLVVVTGSISFAAEARVSLGVATTETPGA